MIESVQAPTTWEELASFASTRVEFPKSWHEPKGSRQVSNEWVLSEKELPGGKVEKIVVRLGTIHSKDRKVVRSTITWFTRVSEPGSPFVSEISSPFSQKSALVLSTPVPRYSAKLLLAGHEAALALVESDFGPFAQVASDALSGEEI